MFVSPLLLELNGERHHQHDKKVSLPSDLELPLVFLFLALAQAHAHAQAHPSLVEDLLGDILGKVVDSVTMREEEERHHRMVNTVDSLQAKYMEKYLPQKEGDIIHSAEVAIPRIDFSKVKPHLHKKLPQPVSIAVQGCYPDPASSESQEKCSRCLWRLGDKSHNTSDYTSTRHD